MLKLSVAWAGGRRESLNPKENRIFVSFSPSSPPLLLNGLTDKLKYLIVKAIVGHEDIFYTAIHFTVQIWLLWISYMAKNLCVFSFVAFL